MDDVRSQGSLAFLTCAQRKVALPPRTMGALGDAASPDHMLLYIPIDITVLWNVRKCVVLASASS